MKGMDSSEESDEDVERSHAEPKQDSEPIKDDTIKSSYQKSSYEKLVIHNRNAMKKTVSDILWTNVFQFNSFICLTVLLVISFGVSTYELQAQSLSHISSTNQTLVTGHHKHHKHHKMKRISEEDQAILDFENT